LKKDAAKCSDSLDSLREAAERGDTIAQSELGWCYHTGAGVARDFALALMWYQKAAELGEASAQNRTQPITRHREQIKIT
jgi:TPR repeat protein